MGKRLTSSIALILSVPLLAACIQDRLPPQNYRITLTIEEGGNKYTGTSVIHHRDTKDLGGFGWQNNMHTYGHAPFVMLPGGSMVAQTLLGWSGYYYWPHGFSEAIGQPVHVKREDLPEVVLFTNASDPSSEVPLSNFRGPLRDDPTASSKITFVDEIFEPTDDPADLSLPPQLSWMSERVLRNVKTNQPMGTEGTPHPILNLTGWDFFRTASTDP